MTITIPSLAVAGEIINVSSGARNVTITLPNPANEYILSAQISTRSTCWLSGISGNQATFSFGIAADPSTQLTLLALPTGMSGLHSTVLSANTNSYSISVSTGQLALPIVTWNTNVWYALLGNTITFFFSNPPVADVNFSYLVVGAGQNTIINAQPLDPGSYSDTISTPANDNYLPIAVSTWNTAIGLTPVDGAVEVGFTNGSPSFAATQILVVSIPLNVSVFPLPAPVTVPIQQPWVVNQITPEQFAVRLVNLFPYPWLSDFARVQGGIAYAIFLAMGECLNYISQQLYYAWTANRLQTATNGALDLFSMDYFGNNLPRMPGESDDAFRARIQALLLQPKITRQAIINAIEFAFPGTHVRMIEPWNPGDTGGYSVSYYDYDSEAIPSLYGNPARRYTGFLEISLPPASELAFSLWGFDGGAAYDAQTGWYFLPVEALQTQIGQINNFINQIVAVGTQIWVKYINGIVNPFTVGGSFNIATGLFNFNINTPSVIGFYELFCQLSQPINVWQTGSNLFGFNVTTSAPVPSGTVLNYVAIENGTHGLGVASVNTGNTTYSQSVDAVNNVVFIQPKWNTSFWYSGRSVNQINFEFSTPCPTGSLMNYFVLHTGVNAGYATVSANALTKTISLTVDSQDIPLVIPNWNTSVGCLPNPVTNQIVLTFSTPAPSDGSGEVMFVSYATG